MDRETASAQQVHRKTVQLVMWMWGRRCFLRYTDGAHILLIYCTVYKYTAYFGKTTILPQWHSCINYVQCGPWEADGFKLATLDRWQQQEKLVRVAICVCVCVCARVCMCAHVCVRAWQPWRECKMEHWSVWQCVFVTKHFIRSNLVTDVYHAFWAENFVTTVEDSCQLNTVCGQVKQWSETVYRKRRSQVLEELNTGEHGVCKSCAWVNST
jgi:hypothetical protein